MRPHPNPMLKTTPPAPPPPPPSINVSLSGGGDIYINGAGCAMFSFSGSASGGVPPYSFSIGFGTVTADTVDFQLELCAENGQVVYNSVNLSATDANGVSGNSGPVFYQLHSNPV